MNDTEIRNAIFKVFTVRPLKQDEMAMHIPLDKLRGVAENEPLTLVEKIASFVQSAGAAGQFTSHVVAGHRGSGKSTELVRLKHQLETGIPKFFVVFCRAEEDIDRNDVDFPEVLLAIVRQLAEQLKQREGISLKPGYFKSRFDWWVKVFSSPIEFEKFDLSALFLKISGAIKNSPSSREQVRKFMEPDTDNLLQAANDVISEATLELSKKDYQGLTIIVDDLDKMIIRPVGDGKIDSDKHLFLNRAPQMTGFSCHIIYSMPISLAYSHSQQVKDQYNKRLPMIPMVKIKSAPPKSKEYKPGIKAMRKMIDARLEQIGVPFERVFESESVCELMIKLSGGQPIMLMAMIPDAVISEGLPITAQSLERIRRENKRDYKRSLLREDWEILEVIRSGKPFQRTEAKEERFRMLLENRALLMYVNDEEWYGLNPFVELLEPPAGIQADVSTS
jgi:hypothetical protein